jgi:hypothetical protein
VPIKAQKLGNGTLSIGAIGSPLDLSAQITNCRLSPAVDKEDPVTTLSGDSLAGTRTITWTLAGTMLQDISDAGVIEWLFTHAGEEVPFTWTPNTEVGTDFTGTIVVDPIEIGGDVGAKNSSDFEFEVVGQPVMSAGLT